MTTSSEAANGADNVGSTLCVLGTGGQKAGHESLNGTSAVGSREQGGKARPSASSLPLEQGS